MKVNIEITDRDKEKLTLIIDRFKSEVTMPRVGMWKEIRPEELWEQIIVQYCVIGSARIGELMRDESRYGEFLANLSLDRLISMKTGRVEYIAGHLRAFNATRFHNKQAKCINRCIENEAVVSNGNIVLLDDLEEGVISDKEMRDRLIERLPGLKMKSVSDFMIKVGATRNFIAFDVRVMGILKNHFDLPLNDTTVQSCKELYEILEETLGKACGEIGVEPSLLDRVLFQCSASISRMFRSCDTS